MRSKNCNYYLLLLQNKFNVKDDLPVPAAVYISIVSVYSSIIGIFEKRSA